MTIDLAAADFGIRQLYARYCDAVWRKDRALFETCFAQDAVWEIAGETLKGREYCGEFFERAVTVSDLVTFWPGPIALAVVDDALTGHLQVTELIKRGQTGIRTLGTYHDRYTQEHGAWLLAHHRHEMIYMGAPDLSDDLV